jgi:hypothetical protein
MKVNIAKNLESISDLESDLIFVVNNIFSYGDYLFIFGKDNVEKVDSFLKKVQKVYPYNCDVFRMILKDTAIRKMIKAGNGFCTEPSNSVGGVVFIPERSDELSIAYHEIVHLVDYILDFSGISNDTETRALIFEYYERIISEKRKPIMSLDSDEE